MKALVLRAKHDVQVGELPVPEMDENSVKDVWSGLFNRGGL